MDVREVLTKWGFKIEHEKLDNVEKQLEGIKSRLEVLAAAEIVRGVYELTERFAHFAEELHVAAESAGLTVEAFQKLSFAAGQSAVSQEEMEHSMGRLTRNLYEARKGGLEAQKVFADAGFSQQQIGSFKTGQDVMLALADKFKGIEDPIKKQAIAMELMGRGSVHMVGFLSQGSGAIKGLGSEAQKLGIILSGAQVHALVEFEHALNEIFAIVKSLGAVIASYFAPSLETAIHELIKFYEVNRKLIDINLRTWVWDVTYAMGFIWGAIKFVTQAVIDLAKAFGIDKYIGTAIFAFVAYVATLFAVQKAMGLVSAASNLLKWSMGPLVGVLKLVRGLASGLVWAFTRLLGSEVAAAAGATVLGAPLWLIVAVIGVLTVGIHDLWTVLSGGKFEDTWIGKMVNGAKSLANSSGLLKKLTGGPDEKGGGGVMNTAKDFIGNMLGIPGLGEISNITNMFGTDKGAAGAAHGPQNYEVNAPINIHVPSGTDHKVVGQKVKDGVKEHLDRVYRETQRSLRPAQAY